MVVGDNKNGFDINAGNNVRYILNNAMNNTINTDVNEY